MTPFPAENGINAGLSSVLEADARKIAHMAQETFEKYGLTFHVYVSVVLYNNCLSFAQVFGVKYSVHHFQGRTSSGRCFWPRYSLISELYKKIGPKKCFCCSGTSCLSLVRFHPWFLVGFLLMGSYKFFVATICTFICVNGTIAVWRMRRMIPKSLNQ